MTIIVYSECSFDKPCISENRTLYRCKYGFQTTRRNDDPDPDFHRFPKNEERYVKERHICYEMTKSKVLNESIWNAVRTYVNCMAMFPGWGSFCMLPNSYLITKSNIS